MSPSAVNAPVNKDYLSVNNYKQTLFLLMSSFRVMEKMHGLI
jgi:hypothetical protein